MLTVVTAGPKDVAVVTIDAVVTRMSTSHRGGRGDGKQKAESRKQLLTAYCLLPTAYCLLLSAYFAFAVF